MRNVYQCQPKEYIIKKYISYFSIQVNEFEFNKSVTLVICLFDENNYIITNEIIKLEGQDYLRWGTDDNYIINYICQKYNLTLQK